MYKEISDEEYDHAAKIWDTFEITTKKDYHDLYLKRSLKITYYVRVILNSSHYLSAPSLSWDAMLSMTKVELELILDADMCLFFEKAAVTRTMNF